MQLEAQELKEKLKKELKEVAKNVTIKDRMKIGLHLDIGIDAVNRNLRGEFETKIEQAELILKAAKNIVSKKELQIV